MNVDDIGNDQTLFLIGAPRSGTTWLGKILDSHPMVLYRHEPDTVLRDAAMQRIFCAEDYNGYRDHAADYLRTLVAARVLKSNGTLPAFPKAYRGSGAHFARLGLTVALRAMEKLTLDAKFARRLQLPDFVDPAHLASLRVVVKSNISRGRAGLFAAARPGSRFLLLVRDPFGQVASMLRGIELGKFERSVSAAECLDTPQAQRYGLSRALFDRLPPVEQHAWHWALLNEKAMDDLADADSAMLVRYQDLVANPHGKVRDIFAFAGLSWNAQTERFLKASTSATGPDRYYQIYKDSNDSLVKWRRQLSNDDQRRIASTIAQTRSWGLYPEFHDAF